MKNKNIYYSPFYWLAWIALGILWIILKLPYPVRIFFGILIGRIVFLFPIKSKHVTEVNLSLCFPELPLEKRIHLAKKSFDSLGMALIESAMAWLLPKKSLLSLYKIHGLEHIQRAFEDGNGALLITPHFSCVELAARFLSLEEHFGILYKPHKKLWLSSIQEFFRKKHFKENMRTDEMKKLLNALRKNKAIWYAYDIDESGKRSVFAPFFGIPTATLTTICNIAHLSKAAIIPMYYYRRKDLSGYDIIFYPALSHFPSLHKLADATRLNAILEEIIRKKPEQYVWQYKRFKTRPKGEKRFYYSDNFPPRKIKPG